jgi:hypothetical protein
MILSRGNRLTYGFWLLQDTQEISYIQPVYGASISQAPQHYIIKT